MESIQHIKKRLRSVGSIGKITKAMELVAATKMRKAQEMALASRNYAFAAMDLLANLTTIEYSRKLPLPILFQSREITKILFILVTSDRGLTGAFNSNIFRAFESLLRTEPYQHKQFHYMAIGKKAAQYLDRKKMIAEHTFIEVGDYATLEEVQPIADIVMDGYVKELWDEVVVISMHFHSALRQEPLTRSVLPITLESIRETLNEIIPTTGKYSTLHPLHNTDQSRTQDYLIEPSPEEVLDQLSRHLVSMQFYHLTLEANASEHSARRMAMKTASDNAQELSEELQLTYNKSRQAGITNQIIEIASGTEALS